MHVPECTCVIISQQMDNCFSQVHICLPFSESSSSVQWNVVGFEYNGILFLYFLFWIRSALLDNITFLSKYFILKIRLFYAAQYSVFWYGLMLIVYQQRNEKQNKLKGTTKIFKTFFVFYLTFVMSSIGCKKIQSGWKIQ